MIIQVCDCFPNLRHIQIYLTKSEASLKQIRHGHCTDICAADLKGRWQWLKRSLPARSPYNSSVSGGRAVTLSITVLRLRVYVAIRRIFRVRGGGNNELPTAQRDCFAIFPPKKMD